MEPNDDLLFEPPSPPLPSLALPFAVVGAAAGWLSAGFIANPLFIWGEEGHEGTAALCGLVFGALLGLVLRRISRPPRLFARIDLRHVKFGLAVLLVGSLTGGVTARLVVHYKGALQEGLLLGLACAVPFLPICALVLRAAKRAGRARMGSIVAAADKREIWSILLSCIALASLAGVFDWFTFARGQTRAPIGALVIAVGAGIAIAALWRWNRISLRQIAAATEGVEAQAEGAGFAADDSLPKVDFGLGEEISARLSRSAAAYRSRARAVSLVVGSRAEADLALEAAMRKNKIGLSLCAVALLVHGAAATSSLWAPHGQQSILMSLTGRVAPEWRVNVGESE